MWGRLAQMVVEDMHARFIQVVFLLVMMFQLSYYHRH